jgi:hypothetical protein
MLGSRERVEKDVEETWGWGIGDSRWIGAVPSTRGRWSTRTCARHSGTKSTAKPSSPTPSRRLPSSSTSSSRSARTDPHPSAWGGGSSCSVAAAGAPRSPQSEDGEGVDPSRGRWRRRRWWWNGTMEAAAAAAASRRRGDLGFFPSAQSVHCSTGKVGGLL